MKKKILLFAVGALLAGCAQTPGRGNAKVDEAAVDTIYAEIARASAAADAALARGRVGDPGGASIALTSAREQLTAAGGRCIATPGCEIERVLAAQDALIEGQSRVLLGADESA